MVFSLLILLTEFFLRRKTKNRVLTHGKYEVGVRTSMQTMRKLV